MQLRCGVDQNLFFVQCYTTTDVSSYMLMLYIFVREDWHSIVCNELHSCSGGSSNVIIVAKTFLVSIEIQKKTVWVG